MKKTNGRGYKDFIVACVCMSVLSTSVVMAKVDHRADSSPMTGIEVLAADMHEKEFPEDEEDWNDEETLPEGDELLNNWLLPCVEPFDYWVACGIQKDFSSLTNADRCNMSLDILVDVLNPDDYGEDYYTFDRKDAEETLQFFFGSDFSPSDQDFENSGYQVSGKTIRYPVGDWGEDPPQLRVTNISETGDSSYAVSIVYEMPVWDSDEWEDRCEVTWQLAWDKGKGGFIICDAALHIIDGQDEEYYEQFDLRTGYHNKGEYILPDSDCVKYTRSQLSGYSTEELRIARNEIYARYGRRFKDEKLQKHFDDCSWYHGSIEPDDFDAMEILNSIEKANVKMIKKLEEERDGEDVRSSGKQTTYSADEIADMVYNYYHTKFPTANVHVEDVEVMDEDTVSAWAYETYPDHWVTFGYLEIDRHTGIGFDKRQPDVKIDFAS